MTITYISGDATLPQGSDDMIIAHIVNDVGAMGKGFAKALMNRYPSVLSSYRAWHRNETWGEETPFALGQVQVVQVIYPNLLDLSAVYVANMIGQHDYRRHYQDPPRQYVDYDALRSCLKRLNVIASDYEASVHMPEIGCGLGGGSWDVVSEMIERYIVDVPVTVYRPSGR